MSNNYKRTPGARKYIDYSREIYSNVQFDMFYLKRYRYVNLK